MSFSSAITAIYQDTKLLTLREPNSPWEIPLFSLREQTVDDEDLSPNSFSTTSSATASEDDIGDAVTTSLIGNCTINQFQHRVVVLPPKEAQPGWLDLSKDYNVKCVETYGSALVSDEKCLRGGTNKSGRMLEGEAETPHPREKLPPPCECTVPAPL